MTELQRYLAEEVVEDHRDGIITRREAVRRLGLLGVAGTAAGAMLASRSVATAVAKERDPAGHRTSARGAASEWAPVPTQEVTFPALDGRTLMGAWAPSQRQGAGVLVIHENRGLNDHIRSVAGRFAASGFSALALDLLSEEGGTGAFPDEAAVAAALAQVPPARFDADMKAAVTELQRRTGDGKVAAIGFCFGGGMVWRLLAAGEDRLRAAAPFYGPFPEGGDLSDARAAVLGVYAGLDMRVNATRDAARRALEHAKLRHEILTFTEANHAFFNDTGARFDAPAAEEAFRRATGWFESALS